MSTRVRFSYSSPDNAYITNNDLHSFIAVAIPVTIMDFNPDEGPIYSPETTVRLTCSADSRFGAVNITWTSTCTDSCFVLQQSAQASITRDILHSVDSGNHTCMVVDGVGNSGNATIEMRVSGTYT